MDYQRRFELPVGDVVVATLGRNYCFRECDVACQTTPVFSGCDYLTTSSDLVMGLTTDLSVLASQLQNWIAVYEASALGQNLQIRLIVEQQG